MVSDMFSDYFTFNFHQRKLEYLPCPKRNTQKPSYRKLIQKISGKLLEFEPELPSMTDQVVRLINL